MSYESNRELLLGSSGEHAEELAAELGIRERFLSELQQSGKASLATITFQPNQRACVFQLVKHEGRIDWECSEGEAVEAHKHFERINPDAEPRHIGDIITDARIFEPLESEKTTSITQKNHRSYPDTKNKEQDL